MDCKDYRLGANQEFFWFKGKAGLIKILLKKLKANRKLKILNVGVGTGHDLEVIAKFGDIFAIDVDQQALEIVSPEFVVEKRFADVCQLPYENNFFDVVVAFDVLEHIKNDQLAIKEICRVLIPGGKFVFTLPAFNFLFSQHDKILGHFRRYNKKTIKKRLESFDCIHQGYWMFFGFYPLILQRKIFRSSNTIPRLPKGLNYIAAKALDVENWVIKKGGAFPFGASLYGIYEVKK